MPKEKTKRTHKDTKYKQEGRRTQNKIKHFIKHNIPADSDSVITKKLMDSFIELQKNRKRGK
jgi:hypothetical protein